MAEHFFRACELYLWIKTAEHLEVLKVTVPAVGKRTSRVNLKDGTLLVVKEITTLWQYTHSWCAIARQLEASIEELRAWIKQRLPSCKFAFTKQEADAFLSDNCITLNDTFILHPSGVILSPQAYDKLRTECTRHQSTEKKLICNYYETYLPGRVNELLDFLMMDRVTFLHLVVWHRGTLLRQDLAYPGNRQAAETERQVEA